MRKTMFEWAAMIAALALMIHALGAFGWSAVKANALNDFVTMQKEMLPAFKRLFRNQAAVMKAAAEHMGSSEDRIPRGWPPESDE